MICLRNWFDGKTCWYYWNLSTSSMQFSDLQSREKFYHRAEISVFCSSDSRPLKISVKLTPLFSEKSPCKTISRFFFSVWNSVKSIFHFWDRFDYQGFPYVIYSRFGYEESIVIDVSWISNGKNLVGSIGV